MQITVSRGAGDRQGNDVIDSLLATEPVGVARGKREIDYSSTPRVVERCQCPKHSFMATGSLVRITEANKQWRGVIKNISITLTMDQSGQRFTADTGLNIERERQ